MENKHYNLSDSDPCNNGFMNIRSFALLPTWYRPLGWLLTLGAFIAFILIAWLDLQPEPARTFIRTAMLLGLFFVSLSKEQLEDERTSALRTQSFAWAFLFGIGYTIMMPYLDYSLDKLMGKPGLLNDLTGFETLSMLLVCQFAFYRSLKLMY